MAKKPKSLAGTLKCQIIKPLNASWDEVGARMRVLRQTVAAGLNTTMRETHEEAWAVIAKMSDAKKNQKKHKAANTAKGKWANHVESGLLRNWNTEIERLRKFKKAKPDDRAFAPVRAYLPAETRHGILARFAGKALGDLMASRASVPSWTCGAAFYARRTECPASGPAEKARLEFPLWSGGAQRVQFAVAPCGGGHEALWDQLVAGEIKQGRVGIAYDERKHKWYALISWTRDLAFSPRKGQSAATNQGVNVFLYAIAEDGTRFQVPGDDILVHRRRFAHRRRQIQKSLDTMGKGSRGHGRKRRLKPLTDVGDKEHRFMVTKSRQVASTLIKWCLRHNVAKLYIENLSGIRDDFETETEGEAHAEVKRLIHNWAFYHLQQYIVREGLEHNVEVVEREPYYNSQRCPSCGHIAPENIKQIQGRTHYKAVTDQDGKSRVYYRHSNWTRFECQKCFLRAHGDVVAAANHLEAAGCKNPLKQAKRRARKEAVRSAAKRLNGKNKRDNGKANGKKGNGAARRQTPLRMRGKARKAARRYAK